MNLSSTHLQMLASSLWTKTQPTDSFTCHEGTEKLPSRETPSPTLTALPGSTPCHRSCVRSPSLEAPTTGRQTGVGRGLPSASPTKASRDRATVTAAASATTASHGAFSALIPVTQPATTRTSKRSARPTPPASAFSWITPGVLSHSTLLGKPCL